MSTSKFHFWDESAWKGYSIIFVLDSCHWWYFTSTLLLAFLTTWKVSQFAEILVSHFQKPFSSQDTALPSCSVRYICARTSLFLGAKWNSWSNVMSRNDLILPSKLKLHVYVCKSCWFIQTLPKIAPTDWHCSTHLSILPSNLFRTSELWWWHQWIYPKEHLRFFGGMMLSGDLSTTIPNKGFMQGKKNKAISRYNNCYK